MPPREIISRDDCHHFLSCMHTMLFIAGDEIYFLFPESGLAFWLPLADGMQM